MNEHRKYSPSRWVIFFNRLNLLAMLLAGPWSLWTAAAFLYSDYPFTLAPFIVVALPALGGYWVFTIILFKEFAPESLSVALRLTLLPWLTAGLLTRLADADTAGFFAALGGLMFTGLPAAMILLFSLGTHLQRKEENAPPGVGGARWLRGGHSLWDDPHIYPMSRYVMGFVFFLPGVLAMMPVSIQLWKVELLEGGIVSLIGWPLACVLTAWLYARQMNGLSRLGLILGPGRDSFSR
ncbi:MAG TPA: hypothetical protein PKW95_02895 [bacterium]|nr:hypothetical protein [bacterium]